MAGKGLASRLYLGEAGINIIGRRKTWFTVAAVAVLIALLSFGIRGFSLGIEFSGGNEFQIPATVGTLDHAQDAVSTAVTGLTFEGEPVRVVSGQAVKPPNGVGNYLVRTTEMEAAQSTAVKSELAQEFGIASEQISDSRVSGAWGAAVTQRALLGLVIFLVLVTLYLVLRFEWRMAVAAVSSLILDLVLTAGVYSLVGFEVTPSTIIGFLTILGFALYDVVVVFDKVQENTRGITAGSSMTYGEAANLAVNQTLMRSINTGLVALLPVGGLLFIGAGLLGAGTLKDLGLVLFVGMGLGVVSSIMFATPVLTALKDTEPRIEAHNQRVLARRAAVRPGEPVAKSARAPQNAAPAAEQVGAVAGPSPKVGARPTGKRPGGGNRGGRGGGAGSRPQGGGKRR